jgi:hypothetical protein
MRAREFILEEKVGVIGRRRGHSTVGLNKFRDAQFADRFYELNRVMMAAACTDGEIIPEVDAESWSGRNNVAAPYTQCEQDMLVKAYKAVGSDYKDINKGDLRSLELPSTNRKSPVVAFKGYPR